MASLLMSSGAPDQPLQRTFRLATTVRGRGGREDDMRLLDHGNRWSVAIEGAQVLRAVFDWAITLAIGSPEEAGLDVRIEQPCILLDPDGKEVLLVPDGDPAQLAPTLRVLRRSAVRVDAFKDGHLELEFAGGYVLSVPAAEDYEPWEISGPNGVRLVSVPGGSVSVWEDMAR